MRIKKMCAALTALFLTIVLPMQALAASSDAEILNYLQTFSKEIITDDGDTFTLRYDLDELTETELSYTIDYIAEVGTTRFEQEVFGDTSGDFSIPIAEYSAMTSASLLLLRAA